MTLVIVALLVHGFQFPWWVTLIAGGFYGFSRWWNHERWMNQMYHILKTHEGQKQ